MKYAVTAVDHGETCDDKARFLGLFGTEQAALDFLKADMDEWHKRYQDEGCGINYARMVGCFYYDPDVRREWNVEQVEDSLIHLS